jgi:cell division protein FtsB
MSAALAGSVALTRRATERPLDAGPTTARLAHPVLRLVPNVRTGAPRAPFITLVVLLLAGGLLGLLALNTVLAQDAFRLHALSAEGKALADREQVLAREVESLRTPRTLAARARSLGMVPAGSPAFLRLDDGAVLGAEVPAEPVAAAEGVRDE